jgi:starch synthase
MPDNQSHKKLVDYCRVFFNIFAHLFKIGNIPLIIMEKIKVLFVSHDITPYLKDSHMGLICRHLPQGIQERGREIRTFMPRFGNINERRNQLHEVIRLSGMNLIINDNDHPLIIKVASIQSARMQVYFIDNDDYFSRKYLFKDKSGKFYKDNDERTIFFSRGVLETVKKLGWPPDLIHCHGWMGSLVPIFVKTAYAENPVFSDSKIVFSFYNDGFEEVLGKDIMKKIKLPGITLKHLKHYKNPTYVNLLKAAIDFSDAFIMAEKEIDPEVKEYALSSGKPILDYYEGDDYIKVYNDFYNKLLETNND